MRRSSRGDYKMVTSADLYGCYLSRLLLLTPLLLLRLHQTLLSAQQLFVQNICLVFHLRVDGHTDTHTHTVQCESD